MQDWKNSDLKTLFRVMRDRDRESATPFQRDWEQARSRLAIRRRTSFRLAMAIASMIAVALGAAVIVRIVRVPLPPAQHGSGSQDLSAGTKELLDRAQPPPAPPRPDPSGVGGVVSKAPGSKRNRIVHRSLATPENYEINSRMRHRDQGTEAYSDGQLISAWRSPTDFLLQSPGNDLLKTVPNLEDSVVRIDRRH